MDLTEIKVSVLIEAQGRSWQAASEIQEGMDYTNEPWLYTDTPAALSELVKEGHMRVWGDLYKITQSGSDHIDGVMERARANS